jgi:hypothetical protein
MFGGTVDGVVTTVEDIAQTTLFLAAFPTAANWTVVRRKPWLVYATKRDPRVRVNLQRSWQNSQHKEIKLQSAERRHHERRLSAPVSVVAAKFGAQ